MLNEGGTGTAELLLSPIEPLLTVRGVTVRFGAIVALDAISFDVPRGSITGLIGPNGAGKTTLFNCLSRLYDYSEGSISFSGRAIEKLSRHQMAKLGVGRTFQNLALFKSMSVLDNIKVGCHARLQHGFFAHALRLPGVAAEEKWATSRAWELVSYLGLGSMASARVADLTFATQKRVELGRALACEPSLLLLDEPAAGLNHEEVTDLGELIRNIRDTFKLTILLVEHHMNLVMNISDHVIVLNFGKKIAEGQPAQVGVNLEVIQAYLGSND